MRRFLLATGLWAFGCAAPETATGGDEPIAVLDAFSLTQVAAEADPLATHRPAEVDCPAAAWGPEGGGFEIQTGFCNYAAFDQALPTAVEAGDELSIIVWHDVLDAPEEATAHVAVWLGDDVLWEDDANIPGPSQAFEAVVPIETTPPPGARLGLHLHNHGFNSWRFVTIDVLPR